MFGFLKKDPVKKLEGEYKRLLEKAVDAQRNGKMDVYANLSAQADQILKKIESLEKN
jgi:hypothetical protein